MILTSEKGRADGNLYVHGRDVPEADYALGFDPVTCTWNLLGDAAEYRMSEDRAAVVTLLRQRGPLGPKEIAGALNANRGTMRVLLHRMRTAGQVLASDGVYRVPLGSETPVTGEPEKAGCLRAVTGVTPSENGATVPKSLLHPLLHGNPGCNTPCNSETGTTTPILVPVTRVTEEAGNDRWTR